MSDLVEITEPFDASTKVPCAKKEVNDFLALHRLLFICSHIKLQDNIPSHQQNTNKKMVSLATPFSLQHARAHTHTHITQLQLPFPRSSYPPPPLSLSLSCRGSRTETSFPSASKALALTCFFALPNTVEDMAFVWFWKIGEKCS